MSGRREGWRGPTQLEAHPGVGNPYDITFDTSVSADGGGRSGVRTRQAEIEWEEKMSSVSPSLIELCSGDKSRGKTGWGVGVGMGKKRARLGDGEDRVVDFGAPVPF